MVVVIVHNSGLCALLASALARVAGDLKEAGTKLGLHVPFRSALRLPRPVDPTGLGFICLDLGGVEVRDVALVVVRESVDGATSFPSTASGRSLAGIRAVITSAFVSAIEPQGAIGHGTAPFSNDDWLITCSQVSSESTSSRDVLGWAHCDSSIGEDLVFVMVDYQFTEIVVNTIPVPAWILESIVNEDSGLGIAACPDVTISVAVVLLDNREWC